MSHPLDLFKFCPRCGSGLFEINNEKSKKCKNCEFVYYFNSSAAVVAVILNDKNEILVTRRAKDPALGMLDLPGGFVDMYESAEQALVREVKEELNLDVTEANFCFSLPNIYPYSGFEVHTVDMFFMCKVKTAQTLEANDDVAESFFIAKDKIKLEEVGLSSIRKGLEILINNYIEAEK